MSSSLSGNYELFDPYFVKIGLEMTKLLQKIPLLAICQFHGAGRKHNEEMTLVVKPFPMNET